MSKLDEHTDEELVELAKSAPDGDLRAFDQLVARHQERVLANCRFITRSPDDAQDLAQEVFIKGYFGLARFEGRSQFKTWIQRIKVNHCLNHLRKHRDRQHLDIQDEALEGETDLHVAPQAHRNVEAGDEREAVRAVLDSLPDTLRVPLILRDLDGLSYQEIADSLEIGLSATKMRIKRGREEFRVAYQALREQLDGAAVSPGAGHAGAGNE